MEDTKLKNSNIAKFNAVMNLTGIIKVPREGSDTLSHSAIRCRRTSIIAGDEAAGALLETGEPAATMGEGPSRPAP